MNIITSAKYFNNHARYLKNLAKSCKKLCKIHMLSILSILAYFLYLFLEHSLPFLRNLIGQFQALNPLNHLVALNLEALNLVALNLEALNLVAL